MPPPAARRRRSRKIIASVDEVFEKEKPDAVMIYGDTNSGLAVIPAKRRKIPVFHMEAGNRCFDQRVPEELNRKVIDHLSDVNMVLTEHARRYLLAEGLPAERIFKVGSHLAEVLAHLRPKIDASTILDTLGLKDDGYLLVSAHREENVDVGESVDTLVASLETIAERTGKTVVVSTHPRTRDRLRRRDRTATSPAGPAPAAVRLHRLRPPRARRLVRPLRQRHDHRGGLAPRPPRRHHARRA